MELVFFKDNVGQCTTVTPAVLSHTVCLDLWHFNSPSPILIKETMSGCAPEVSSEVYPVRYVGMYIVSM